MSVNNDENKLFDQFESIISNYCLTKRDKLNKNPAVLNVRLKLEQSIKIEEIESEEYFIMQFAQSIH
jgi:hypothetical protein